MVMQPELKKLPTHVDKKQKADFAKTAIAAAKLTADIAVKKAKEIKKLPKPEQNAHNFLGFHTNGGDFVTLQTKADIAKKISATELADDQAYYAAVMDSVFEQVVQISENDLTLDLQNDSQSIKPVVAKITQMLVKTDGLTIEQAQEKALEIVAALSEPEALEIFEAVKNNTQIKQNILADVSQQLANGGGKGQEPPEDKPNIEALQSKPAAALTITEKKQLAAFEVQEKTYVTIKQNNGTIKLLHIFKADAKEMGNPDVDKTSQLSAQANAEIKQGVTQTLANKLDPKAQTSQELVKNLVREVIFFEKNETRNRHNDFELKQIGLADDKLIKGIVEAPRAVSPKAPAA